MKIIGRNLMLEVPLGDFDAIQIVTDDGRILMEIGQTKNGHIFRVDAGDMCRIDGKLYNNKFTIKPYAANVVYIEKEVYEVSHE
jgi:hypothetical protein